MAKKRGRPSPWNSPTELVRLPSHAIPQCVQLAKRLDQSQPDDFVQKRGRLLISVGEGSDDRSYLLDPPTLPPGRQALIDEVVDQFISGMTEKDLAFALALLAPRVLPEVPIG